MFLSITSVLLVVTAVAGHTDVPDGPRGDGSKFQSCGGGGLFGGSEKCFKVKLVKFSIQMGNDGTNDDVKLKVCSDEKKKTKTSCCTTPYLKRKLSDDWSSNDLETWGRAKMGNCTMFVFNIRRGLEVTLEKKGSDSLEVNSIIIDTEGETGGKTKSFEQFRCGQINAKKNSPGTKLCGSFPYSYEKINIVNVTMGNTGTDEYVKIDICSDVNKVCCKTKLTSLISDDWSRNDVEIWNDSYFGECSGMRYKVNKNLKVGIETKSGLVVNNLVVKTDKNIYDCKGYNLIGKKSQQNICSKKTSSAAKKLSSIGKGKKGLLSQTKSMVEKNLTIAPRPVFKG